MANICLIEDDGMIRDSLKRILEKMGHSVTIAINGREGLNAVDKMPFEVVITDIIMPEVEGIEVIRTVKEKSPKTRIIAMSGGGRVGNTDFLKVAKNLGADEIVYKPVTKTEFLNALNGCLRG
ncbi:response regulator [Kordiimonas pumila]|uniref:Response regulator n=1 Tax=Kordiimonas pumila TaxID=2161677 RepID=A0ABV7D5E2_9PROT|nr:response regulator [Kordiimonas pumila]